MRRISHWSARAFILLTCFFCCLWAFDLVLFAVKRVRTSISVPQSDVVSLATQVLHPYYFFFFPTRPEQLVRINHGKRVPWIDARGFGGGLGPERRGERKLAFLLGGSTAFGDGATDHDAVISSQMNRMQDEYFFVNAGVPSWSSYQELLRFLKEVIPESPKLVISLTGSNDITNAYVRGHLKIPTDTPESFETLHKWVEDIRSDEFRRNAVWRYLGESTVWGTLFLFNLRTLVWGNPAISRPEEESDLPFSSKAALGSEVKVKENLDEITAQTLYKNLAMMRALAQHHKFQYLAILQPEREIDLTEPPLTERGLFYGKVIQHMQKFPGDFIQDLSRPSSMGVENLELSDYIDNSHFTDLGYQKIARGILSILRNKQLLNQ